MMHISKLRKPKHLIKLESTKFILMTKYKTTIDLHKIDNKISRTILISQQHSFQSFKILTFTAYETSCLIFNLFKNNKVSIKKSN